MRRPNVRHKGGTMGQWRANGMPADDTALEDLGLVDQSVLCHCHGGNPPSGGG